MQSSRAPAVTASVAALLLVPGLISGPPGGAPGAARSFALVAQEPEEVEARATRGRPAGPGSRSAAPRVDLLDDVQAVREGIEEAGFDLDVGSLGSRSGPALVVRYQGLAPFFVEGGVSFRLYQRHRAGLAFGGETWSTEVRGAYHHLREPHFWGLGPGSRSEDRSDFSLERVSAEVVGTWTPVGGAGELELSADLGLDRTEARGGHDDEHPDAVEVFAPGTVFGLGQRVQFLRAGVGLELDRTRIRRNQELGRRATLGVTTHHGVGGTDAGFHRASADLAAYLPLDRRQVLAFRLLATEHFGERGSGVPFYLLADLGDDDGLRGYRSYRFRDRALLAAQAEWRWDTWSWGGEGPVAVETFVFVDHGMVAPSLGALEASGFRTTPGLGLRALISGDRLAEAFVAFGGDKARLSGSFGVTF